MQLEYDDPQGILIMNSTIHLHLNHVCTWKKPYVNLNDSSMSYLYVRQFQILAIYHSYIMYGINYLFN